MIKNIFEFLGGLGFVMLIISICMYIQAKGDTQKADELLREEIKKATEKQDIFYQMILMQEGIMRKIWKKD